MLIHGCTSKQQRSLNKCNMVWRVRYMPEHPDRPCPGDVKHERPTSAVGEAPTVDVRFLRHPCVLYTLYRREYSPYPCTARPMSVPPSVDLSSGAPPAGIRCWSTHPATTPRQVADMFNVFSVISVRHATGRWPSPVVETWDIQDIPTLW